MKLFKIVTALCILLVLVWVSPATSHTRTQFFMVDVTGLPNEGPADRVAGNLVLKNLFPKDSFVVTLGYREQVSTKQSDNIRVAPGGSATIPFRAAPLKEGKQIVILELVVKNDKGVLLGTQPVDLYFTVRNKKYTRTTYEKLYVPPIKKTPDGTPPAVSGKAIKANPGERVVPLPRNVTATMGHTTLELHKLPAPGKTLRINKPTSSLTDTDNPMAMKHPAAEPAVTSFTGASTATPQGSGGGRGFSTLNWAEIFSPVSTAEAQSAFTVTGQFAYRGLDNQFHPAWNWRVEAWWNKRLNKRDASWVRVGSDYVGQDGRWSIHISQPGYTGQHLRIQYRPGNDYIMPQGRNGNQYWWFTEDFRNIPANFDIGLWHADTSSTGILAGLGDVFNAAQLFWNAFVSNGLNPQRAVWIKLFFPNTWYDCGRQDHQIWSCASLGAEIWLIPSHVDSCTIQHELSHQLNFEYWHNARPSNSSGSHIYTNCYTTGLALIEGFANFAPNWVLNGANATAPTDCGFTNLSLESPSKTAYCNGDTNETWVAATFWDLIDHHNDGTDVTYFVNPMDVFSIYLGNGVKPGIKGFRQDLMNILTADYHPYIDDIFKNNTITVP